MGNTTTRQLMADTNENSHNRGGDASVLIILMGLSVVLSSADTYMGSGTAGLVPLRSTELGLFLVGAMFAIALVRSVHADNGRSLVFAYSGIVPVLVASAMVAIVRTSGAWLPDTYWIKSEYIYIPLYDFILFFLATGVVAIPTFRRHHRKIAGVSLLLISGSIAMDIANPGMFAAFSDRAAGFAFNSNYASEVVNLSLIAAVNWRRFLWRDTVLWGIAGLALYCTLSRSGALVYFVCVTAYIIIMLKNGTLRLQTFLRLAFGLSLVGTVVGPTVLAFINGQEMFSTYYVTSGRMDSLLKLLGGDVASVQDDERLRKLAFFLEMIEESPLLGRGLYYHFYYEVGPHNMFLELWLSAGLAGLISAVVLYVALFAHFIRLRDARGVVFTIAFFIYAFFNHNLFDDRPVNVFIGLLAALAAWEAAEREASAWEGSTPRAAGCESVPASLMSEENECTR